MEAGPNESAPLVRGGVLYLPNSGDVIKALDAQSGDLIWEYRRELPSDVDEGSPVAVVGPIHRNIAIWDDGIFVSTADAHVIRLDANTGELVWETEVGDYHHITHTSGPIIVNGKVISGRTCDMGLPGGCYITAHDAEDGRELWRFYPIPRPGEPGDETWGGLPLEKRFHVGAWFVGSYDPELELIYWGTSVPAPSPEILRGTGDGEMLYSNSTVALDPETGKLVWYFQHLPRDNWDLDHPFERVLVDVEVEPDKDATWVSNPKVAAGEKRKVVTGIPGKNGIVWTLDRETGEFLWARETVYQNVVDRIDAVTGKVSVNLEVIPKNIEDSYGLVCPGVNGGRNWPTTAYSPKTGLLYAPLQNLCMEPTIATTDPKPEHWYGIAMPGRLAPEKTSVGRLEAISVRTGRTAWTFEERAGMFSALTTGGGLVFAGNSNRRFRAFDADNGDILWQMILNGPVTGFPFAYAVDGEQFVSVAVGGGDLLSGEYNHFAGLKVRAGSNVLYSFKLSGTGGGQTRIATGASQSEAAPGGSRLDRAPIATAFAQQRAPLPSSAACVSFTAAQVERGRELYVQECAQCHGTTLGGGSHGLPLSGRTFRGRWSNRPTSSFFATLRETMPPGGEETLGGRATSDLVAFILSENGVQPISDAMAEEPAALRQLRLCPASE